MSSTGSGAWPFRGRTDEVARTLDALRAPGAVVIVGDAGVGKSRLADAVSERLTAQAGTARRIVATTSAAAIPLGVFAPLLDDGAEARRSSPTVLSLVDVAVALRSLPGGLVLTVDDGHLLDASSAAVVAHLACDGASRVIVTVRAGERAPDAVTSLWKDLAGARIDVAALSRLATTEVLDEALGAPVVPATAAAIYAVTRGNPLFVRELVHEGLASGRLHRSRGVWRWDGRLEAGQRLRALVGDRIANLDDQLLAALRIVAFAEPLSLDMALDAVGPDALGRLERSGVVVGDDRQRTVEVAHPLYREVVREETTGSVALLIHDRLVELLGDSVEAGRLVRWWLRSTRRLPLDIEIVLDAATRAWRGTAPELALEYLEAVADVDRDDPRVRLLRGSALVDLHREREAADDFAAAFRAATSDRERMRAAVGRITALVDGDRDLEGASAVLADAEALIDDADALAVVRARHVTAVAQNGGPVDAALVDRLMEHPDPLVRLHAFPAATLIWTDHGGPPDALERTYAMLEPALAAADELPRAVEWIVTALIMAHLHRGDLDDVEVLIDAGQANAVGARADQLAALDVLRSRVLLIRGCAASALAAATRALAVMDHEMPDNTYVNWALSVQAAAAALLGDDEAAAAAVAEAERHDAWEVEVVAYDGRRERTKVSSRRDRTGTARALVRLADECRERGHRGIEFLCLYDAVVLHPDREVEVRLLGLADPSQGRWAECAVRHVRARHANDADELEATASVYEQIGALPLAIAALVEAESVLRRAGLSARADRLRARATRLAMRCEGAMFPALEGYVRRPELTPREQEIAELAAEGLTSAAIAAHLVVSRRTVDNQLNRVYAKLGISGRHELAAALD